MGSFGISEGNITRKKKKNKTPTEYVPKHKCQWTLAFATSEHGLDRETQAA